MMYQQEIKFFWPLTEQIPLDLDYSVCKKPNLTTSSPITCNGEPGLASINWNDVRISTGVGTLSDHSISIGDVKVYTQSEPTRLGAWLLKKIFGWEWK